MGTRLFIGNLPFDAHDDDLKAFLEGEGQQPTSVKVVNDRDTGRSRGFAFADFESAEAAQAAMAALNGKDYGGRPLRVNEAEERSGGNKFGGGGFRSTPHGHDREHARGGFGSRGPGQNMSRGSQRGGGRGGGRGS
jgi:RNA recognition motif-containing protein